MKLRTRLCKKSSLKTTEAAEEVSQKSTNYPLSCVDWSSNEEIYFVRYHHQLQKLIIIYLYPGRVL